MEKLDTLNPKEELCVGNSEYNCPKHGNTSAVIHTYDPLPKAVWCMHCLFEKLEALGVYKVELIENEKGDEKFS